MAELYFVGAGLHDERSLSVEALDRLRACGAIFAEEYTSRLAPGSLERLGIVLGREIRVLTRAELESERPILEALAREAPVGLIVPGDPFAATTHVSLRLAAEDAGHHWTYLPNASALTAIPGFLGLQPYRFGRVVSIPMAEERFRPTSFAEAIGRNREANLHSLVLLDLRPSDGVFLRAPDALNTLRDADPDGQHLPRDALVAVAARVGTPAARAWYGPQKDLVGIDFGPPLHSLVVPAPELHFAEEAALRRIRLDG